MGHISTFKMSPIVHYSDLIMRNKEAIFENTQNGLLKHFVQYLIDSKYRKAVIVKKWLNEQVNEPRDNVWEAAESIIEHDNPDDQVIEILKWVYQNLHYVRDINSRFKRVEYWQEASETLSKNTEHPYKDMYTGDCEDGAILIYVLARLKGVPANRIYICAGDVRGGGHAFCFYKPKNYPLNFVILDWCYWYSSKEVHRRSLFYIRDKEIKEYLQFTSGGFKYILSNYYKIWFISNEDISMTRVIPKWEK